MKISGRVFRFDVVFSDLLFSAVLQPGDMSRSTQMSRDLSRWPAFVYLVQKWWYF